MGIVLSANQKTGHIPIPSRSGVQKGFVLISGHVSRPREILHSCRETSNNHIQGMLLLHWTVHFLKLLNQDCTMGRWPLNFRGKRKMGDRAIKNHFKRTGYIMWAFLITNSVFNVLLKSGPFGRTVGILILLT